MSEAIISRRGTKSNEEYKPSELKTETIVQTQSWIVPDHYGNISVRIFGGGGGSGTNGAYRHGGGSGWMNNGELNLNTSDVLLITIGSGGISGKVGGTSSFGTYLSANGGESIGASNGHGGNGGAGGGGVSAGGEGYQFGGGGGGGNGGIWGGGGGIESYIHHGNGGIYGGGGGYEGYYIPNNYYIGIGGIYGGNGGKGSNLNYIGGNAENGTNTWEYENVPDILKGYGLCGFGNNRFAGGGGYGGNGGNSGDLNNIWRPLGGGGGGYGGNGGICRGGGGGYGRGADGGHMGGGGGGYFAPGGSGYGGGGGGYGRGGNGDDYQYHDGIFGGGGGYSGNGGSGVCIIQYYQKVT